MQREDWLGALESIRHYLQLDPKGAAHIWYYNALSNFRMGNIAAAESARTSCWLGSAAQHPEWGATVAVIQARRSDYSDALAHLRHCLRICPMVRTRSCSGRRLRS